MTGAVAVGMFGRADIAVTILAAHYLSALSVGLVMRFYGSRTDVTPPVASAVRGSLPARAWHALHEARTRDGRPLGQLLGDAIKQSTSTLLVIGGFIILFSVIVETLAEIGVVGALAGLGARGLAAIGMSPAVVDSLVKGTFEITIGTQAASQAGADLMSRVAAASAVIAWSGLSVHAQVAAMIQGRGMKMAPYMAARVLHALLAGAFTFIFWRPVAALTQNWAVPVFWQASPASGGLITWAARLRIWGVGCGLLGAGLFILFTFAVVVRGTQFVLIDLPTAKKKPKPTRPPGRNRPPTDPRRP